MNPRSSFRMRTRILPVACWAAVLLIPAAAYAGAMGDFGPFPDAEEVVRVPLKTCPLVKSARDGTKSIEEYGLPGEAAKAFLTLEVDNPTVVEWTAKLTMNLGEREPTYVAVLEGATWFIDILTADLNGDSRPDLVLPYTVRRKGADRDPAGERPAPGENVLFVLSGKTGHRFMLAENVKFDEEGVISVLNDGTVQWVHTVLIDRHDAKSRVPGRKLYFYLHRLFFVRGSVLEPADGMDPRFPKFVSYYPGTKRRNHKETKLLTEAQKKALVEANPVRVTELGVSVTPPAKPAGRRARP